MPLTVEDYLDHFVALQKSREPNQNVSISALVEDIDLWAYWLDKGSAQRFMDDSGHDVHSKLCLQMAKAAKMYTVARDKGTNAAILWKLSWRGPDDH